MDQGPVWGEGSWGPSNIVLNRGPDAPKAKGRESESNIVLNRGPNAPKAKGRESEAKMCSLYNRTTDDRITILFALGTHGTLY